jgi:hypothetical protein
MISLLCHHKVQVHYFIWQLRYYSIQTVSLDGMELSEHFSLGPRVLVRWNANQVLLLFAMYKDTVANF